MNPPNPQQDKLDQLITEFREEYGTCLDWIFAELNEPENLGYSEFLMDLFKRYGTKVFGPSSTPPLISIIFWFWNGPNFFDKDARRIKSLEGRIRVRKLALEYLPYYMAYDFLGSLRINRSKEIHFFQVMDCYFWLERLYYVSVGRELGFNDALNIYFGGLAERLIFGLDKFDELIYIPVLDSDFFQRLRNVIKIDDDAKRFKNKAGMIIETAITQSEKFKGFYNFPRQPKYQSLKDSEEILLYYFAAFSAANTDRPNITIEDYGTAYKTYYKLLKTDITKFKCQNELLNDKYHGYMVCERCGAVYEPKDVKSQVTLQVVTVGVI